MGKGCAYIYFLCGLGAIAIMVFFAAGTAGLPTSNPGENTQMIIFGLAIIIFGILTLSRKS